MRVEMIRKEYPPEIYGGAGVHVAELVAALRESIDQQNLDTIIEIDGGIDPDTIALAAEAGCDSFVAGSAVFKSDDPVRAVEELRALAARS